ncbi:MAG: hypothetical protein QXX36_00480 [Candidatus Rehaiarchaeum fermentans]|nr:hypothetical protein [Candidatus Rehaiarchaeum fermentans]MCW1292259.1 hypothetical protein [Candidatus Rehaiarchaeum fermentans]MCW1292779.1 hypothetical protein [Candidatus Rehaiarchaeum fermentans]MCW1297207.1 hypothetical protein [Candidatus Rehaiarchaeum fermentans]MCW1302102.1 hypothetical protein [Candidatus Rehaiarchaeum fermentans]
MSKNRQARIKRSLYSKARRAKGIPAFIFLKAYGIGRGAKALISGKARRKLSK